jgi:ActR/RegA family two-component response regulator
MVEAGQTDGRDRRVLLVNDDGREAARLVEAMAEAGLEVRHAPSLATAEDLSRQWSPEAVVILERLPDGSAAPWIERLGVPAVLLVHSRTEHGSVPAAAAVVERSAAAEAVIAALYRVGLRGADGSTDGDRQSPPPAATTVDSPRRGAKG